MNDLVTVTVHTRKRLRTLVGDIVRRVLEDVGGRGDGGRADAAGWDVRRTVGGAVVLGVLALGEARVGRVVLQRETQRQ